MYIYCFQFEGLKSNLLFLTMKKLSHLVLSICQTFLDYEVNLLLQIQNCYFRLEKRRMFSLFQIF